LLEKMKGYSKIAKQKRKNGNCRKGRFIWRKNDGW
jgi:hypothetical protein